MMLNVDGESFDKVIVYETRSDNYDSLDQIDAGLSLRRATR